MTGVETMRSVSVLVFGPAAEAVGSGAVVVDVETNATAGSVLAAMGRQHAALKDALVAGRLAVNGSFASAGMVVEDGDELALIALVSGG